MNHDFTAERQREWARQLYLYEDIPLKDIALKTGAPEAAIRLWMTEGGWDGLKRSLLTSKGFLIAQMYRLLENLTSKMKETDEVNTRDAELLVKYTAAIKNLDQEVDIPAIVQVAKLFTTWLRRKNLELAQQITIQFDAFIKHRQQPFPEL
ncbi:MAG: hypothetical protein EBZ77_17015 [Chitinophagia bacterium]|nr:hypothetical protein [Chitinophagia bacterium]